MFENSIDLMKLEPDGSANSIKLENNYITNVLFFHQKFKVSRVWQMSFRCIFRQGFGTLYWCLIEIFRANGCNLIEENQIILEETKKWQIYFPVSG